LTHVRLSSDARADISWWLTVFENGATISSPLAWHSDLPPDVIVHTDASSSFGFGGWWDSAWFAGSWPDAMRLSSQGSSTLFLELSAILLAVAVWAPLWRGRVVHLYTDNRGAVEAWRARSSQSDRPMAVIRLIALLLIKYGVGLFRLYWLSSEDNFVADSLSRLQNPSLPYPPELASHPTLLVRAFPPDWVLSTLS